MLTSLIVEKGPAEGKKIPLAGRKTVIGRGHECDLQILDESLSRRHCVIEKKYDGYWITDLGSSNGTFVGNCRIGKESLKSGDIISLGARRLRFMPGEADNDVKSALNVVTTVDKKDDGGIKSRLDPARSSLFETPPGELNDQKISERRQRDLATICKIGNIIHSEHDLTRLCELLMASILDVIGADRGCLLMLDDEDVLRPTAVYGDFGQSNELALSSTIVNEALKKGMAVLSSDALVDDRFSSGDSIILNNICSAMCVPMETGEGIGGVLYLDAVGVSNSFSDEDLELLTAIGKQAGVAVERTRLIEDLENLLYDSVTSLVAAIEASDQYTGGHSERVTCLAVGIAEAMGHDEASVSRIRLAGLLHDIGKIGIPSTLLNKTGALEDDEWKMIMTHPELGYGIISKIRRMDDDVAAAVRHHHERWNGRGYPQGLAGTDIPLMSRLLTVADTYDAMTSLRPYREAAFTQEQAVTEIKKCSGEQFDSDVVDAFLANQDKICSGMKI